jgi:hypothetical protein
VEPPKGEEEEKRLGLLWMFPLFKWSFFSLYSFLIISLLLERNSKTRSPFDLVFFCQAEE